jgi:hypothetical protein
MLATGSGINALTHDEPDRMGLAPRAVSPLKPLTLTTRLDQSITLDLQGGDPLKDRILKNPRKGTATLNVDGSVTYSPRPGVRGKDKFVVEVAGRRLVVNVDNNLAYRGRVKGQVGSFDDVEVVLTGDGVLETVSPDASGKFRFYALPDGDYAVKARKPGYKSSPARSFSLDIDRHDPGLLKVHRFVLKAVEDPHAFVFHWEEDQSTAGHDYASRVNQPVVVEFLDEQVEVVDEASANQLYHDYNILLVDSKSGSWTQEHAYRLLETMKSVPQQTRDPYEEQTLSASKWLLTSRYVEDDIEISHQQGHRTVLISAAAFVNASPRVAKVEGKRGTYYSQRLHHALVRFVTDNGSDEMAYEKIFQTRYGVTTLIPDYTRLTLSTTGGEPASRFQAFHPEEIVQLINTLEEMPRGMHKLPELRYLVRRLNGTPHPLYGSAPAVAWPDAGYIEFMESGFSNFSSAYIHRLIIHEKAHFLWAHQFDEQLRADWTELGGWYSDSESESGWSTSNQTEFVSAYAHAHNPDEDMAESIAYFIVNPDKLKSRSLGKYEFVRDRIMQGNVYLSTIREDLTFEVYNLLPDYVFPGKIRRVDIRVEGTPKDDKTVSIELELHALDGNLEGAEYAYMRIFSEIGTFVGLYLYPVDKHGNEQAQGTVLRGSFTLSRSAKAGYWRTNQIILTDSVGNERFERANDFGWKLYINNALDDVTAPRYVDHTASLSKTVSRLEGQEAQLIHATWEVDEDTAMGESQACYASLNDEIAETYRVEDYGEYDPVHNLCRVHFTMPHYMPSSIYRLNYISMTDEALNERGVYFTDPGHALRPEEGIVDEAPQQIELITDNPDFAPPELDINDIQVSAEPTYPDAPNGETLVTITFHVRDNVSGYSIASLMLRDPQGVEHHYWVYNDSTWSWFPEGDPTRWTAYTRSVLLPPGSAPGTWGLAEMTIEDRAGNFKRYDFTEIIHFDVLDEG